MPFHRKPIGNFFILKNLQIRLIQKIVMAGLISTLVCSGVLLLTYFLKYKSVHFWPVQLGLNPDILDQMNIVYIILPSLAISAAVNVIVAACIGLYASRKYAVPVYKLEQWAKLLNQGKLTARMTFREREELKELSTRCNLVTDSLRMRFLAIKKQNETLKQSGITNEAVQRIDEIIAELDLESKSFVVNTGFMPVPEEMKKPPKRN